MDLPSARIREVLVVLRDLNPSDARVLLGQVVATLDAAEVESLRKLLPLQTRHLLPPGADQEQKELAPTPFIPSQVEGPSTRHAGAEVIAPRRLQPGHIDAATVMNTAPMPWELNPAVPPPAFRMEVRSQVSIDTGKIIREAVPRSPRLAIAIIGLASLIVGLILAVIFVPAADQELEVERPRPVVVPRPARTVPVKTVEEARPAPVKAAPAKAKPAPAKPSARKGKKSPPSGVPGDWTSPFERRY